MMQSKSLFFHPGKVQNNLFIHATIKKVEQPDIFKASVLSVSGGSALTFYEIYAVAPPPTFAFKTHRSSWNMETSSLSRDTFTISDLATARGTRFECQWAPNRTADGFTNFARNFYEHAQKMSNVHSFFQFRPQIPIKRGEFSSWGRNLGEEEETHFV